jgi:hypothetical protein
VAVDPERRLVIANLVNVPFAVTLFPGEAFEREKATHPGV